MNKINITENLLLNKIWDKYGYNVFVFLGLIGVFLIFISDGNTSEDQEKVYKNNISSKEYIKELESNLEAILSSVEGAGELKLMITLESGEETVYAWQEKTKQDEESLNKDNTQQISQNNTYENQPVIIEYGQNKQALVKKILQPVIKGVVVVCQGADNVSVVSDITDAVSVALDIPTNRVCVIKMK